MFWFMLRVSFYHCTLVMYIRFISRNGLPYTWFLCFWHVRFTSSSYSFFFFIVAVVTTVIFVFWGRYCWWVSNRIYPISLLKYTVDFSQYFSIKKRKPFFLFCLIWFMNGRVFDVVVLIVGFYDVLFFSLTHFFCIIKGK